MIRFSDGELALIVGYEIRHDTTYLIADNGVSEVKVNILNAGDAYEYI